MSPSADRARADAHAKCVARASHRARSLARSFAIRSRVSRVAALTEIVSSSRRWEFACPKHYDFTAADDAALDEWFDTEGVKSLVTPKFDGRVRKSDVEDDGGGASGEPRNANGERRSVASVAKRAPDVREENTRFANDERYVRSSEKTANRALGAPRRAVLIESEGATPGARRSPRLRALADATKSADREPLDSSAIEHETKGMTIDGDAKALDASGGRQRVKTPEATATRAVGGATAPRAGTTIKVKMTTEELNFEKSRRAMVDEQARMRRERKVYGAAPVPKATSGSTRGAKDVVVERFRSRKEKLLAFETGGRTTDYEDLTKIPARTKTTEAVSPRFTATRRTMKILSTEERELQEIARHQAAAEKERKSRPTVYAPYYSTVPSRLALATSVATRRTMLKASASAVEFDVVEEMRGSRNQSSEPFTTSESFTTGVRAASERKRKRVSVTGTVLTEVTPFHLNTEQRGAYHERKFARRLEEEAARTKKAQAPFKATPIPQSHQAGVSVSSATLAMLKGRFITRK